MFGSRFSAVPLTVLGLLLLVPMVSVAAGLFYIDSVTGFAGFGNTNPQSQVDVSGAIYSRLVTASSSSINWNLGNVQKMTLASNPTLTFSNGQAGGEYTLILSQDGTGGRSVTWPASILWPGGITPTLTSTSNATDVARFVYDGSHYFGSLSNNFIISTGSVNVLIVAGGGGGGFNRGSGGGAGGMLASSSAISSGTGYAVVIGQGGHKETSAVGDQTNGGDSSAFGITAVGGGRGQHASGGNGFSGGSGSGGATSGSGGSGTSGQGNSGGTGSVQAAGGGGGAGANGGAASGVTGGSGGTGSSYNPGSGSVTYSTGGTGGSNTDDNPAGNAAANTGNGGDGGDGLTTGADGGTGGSGIVIISAPTSLGITATGGTHTTAGGNDIWTFTAGGTWTPFF
ncbi:MAG: hypothetical protein JWO84_750 [Parcubacteria group bacterium]|nr:hypothetical protein [Parcubacteria group bacterium]